MYSVEDGIETVGRLLDIFGPGGGGGGGGGRGVATSNRCANSKKQAGATTNKVSSVNLSHMFPATSVGCMHEVVQFFPALGVVSHIIMSIIHRFSSVKPCKCRDEVSEQKYFTL